MMYVVRTSAGLQVIPNENAGGSFLSHKAVVSSRLLLMFSYEFLPDLHSRLSLFSFSDTKSLKFKQTESVTGIFWFLFQY